MIDIHSHILPGIDDGALSMEDSVEMAKIACKCGISQIVATPHYNGAYFATRNEIDKVYEQLCDELEYENIPIKLLKSMEILASDDLPELLTQGKVFTYPESSWFLVEFMPDEEYDYFDWLLDRCVEAGFKPVIAHPERYRAVYRHPEMAKGWSEKGYGVQVNRDSLLGVFGNQAYECSDYLLKRGWANCIASDAHSPQGRNPYWGEAFRLFPRVYSVRHLNRCLKDVPQCILNNTRII